MAKKDAKQKRNPEAPGQPETAAKSQRESPEAFLRRVRLENIRKAIAEGRLADAEAFMKGYLSREMLSQADVGTLQAELARRRGNA